MTPSQSAPRLVDDAKIDAKIDAVVRGRIEACPYRVVFRNIRWQFDDGTLALTGRVPSFYLKQVLQELLVDIEPVCRIANEVDVVSGTGLRGAKSDNSS